MSSRESGVAVLGVGTPVLSGTNSSAGLVEQIVVDFGDDSSSGDSNLLVLETVDIILLVTVVGLAITIIVCSYKWRKESRKERNKLMQMLNENEKV